MKKILKLILVGGLLFDSIFGSYILGKYVEQKYWLEHLKNEEVQKEYIKNKIISYSRDYDISEDLVLSIAWQESRFNQLSLSNKGAIGIMQIMPSTAKDLNINPHFPEENILGGIRYLKWLYSLGLEGDEILIAYNAGIGTLKKIRRGEKNIPKETQDYIVKIRKHMKEKPWTL